MYLTYIVKCFIFISDKGHSQRGGKMKVGGKENRKTFFERFKLKIPPHQLDLLEFAYELAKHGHKGQNREGGGRYFEHPRESALIAIDLLGIFDVEIIS